MVALNVLGVMKRCFREDGFVYEREGVVAAGWGCARGRETGCVLACVGPPMIKECCDSAGRQRRAINSRKG